MTADITAVLVASDEGPLVGISLHSLLDAAAAARVAGLEVEALVVLHRATGATEAAFAEAADHGVRVVAVDSDDPAVVRNAAVAAATGTYLGFLDGGALWSENWLVAAHALAAAERGRVIAHPEIHWFYENGRELYFPPDQDSPDFDPALLRFGSCWDGQPFAASATFRDLPFPEGEHADPGQLAWDWNAAAVAAGHVHRVVPDTVSFRRTRPPTLR